MQNKRTDALINTLASNAQPIKKMMPLWASLLLILSISTFYCYGCITALYGFKDGLTTILSTALFQADIILAITLIIVCLSCALRSATPGKEHFAKTGAYIGVTGIFALLFYTLFFNTWTTDWQNFIPNAHCFFDVALFSTVPVVLTFYIIKKAAPTDLKNTGLVATVATTLIGYVAVELSCTAEGVGHDVLTHIVPLALYAYLGMRIGSKYLRW